MLAFLPNYLFVMLHLKMSRKGRKENMQLGIRMHDTIDMPIEERIPYIRKLGFTCGHLAIGKTMPGYCTTDEALTPGLAMHLRRVFSDNALDCAVLGCYLNLANPDKMQLEKIINRYKAHIRFASILGCGVVGTETGAPNTTYTFTPECHNEESLQIFIANLRTIVEYAEKMGVIIGIEPVFTHIVNTPARARRVLDEIQSPNLQIILDPVNLLDISNVENANEVIDEAICLLGEDVAVIHIKDYIVENGKMYSVGAGMGQMDYSSLMQFIKQRKPYIHATLEDTTPQNCLQCKEYIESIYSAC